MSAPMTAVALLGFARAVEPYEAADGTAAATAASPPIALPSHWPVQVDLLHWCHAATPAIAVLLILGGIVYLLFGFTIFRYLVALNAVLLGGLVGAMLGERSGAEVPAAVVGGLLAATAAWPWMKYSVAVMGAMFGAAVGVTVWRLCDQDPNFAWSGGLTGFVGFGLLSFLLFRGCVMTFTSMQGATMLVLGILALVYKYDEVGPGLTRHLDARPFLLPLTIFVPTLLGFIYQQSMLPKKPLGAPAAAAPAGGPPKK